MSQVFPECSSHGQPGLCWVLGSGAHNTRVPSSGELTGSAGGAEGSRMRDPDGFRGI